MALVSRGGGGSPVPTATKHLTAAMILDIANTPVAVVPAPAANELIYPLWGLYRLTFVTQEYDFDPTFSFAWESNLPNTFMQASPSLATPEDSYSVAPGGPSTGGIEASNDAGAALMVVAPTAAFSPPLGNGTLDITVWYLLMTVFP